MKRTPRPSDLTFTEQLAALDRCGKKATSLSLMPATSGRSDSTQHDKPRPALARALTPGTATTGGPANDFDFLTVAEVAQILRFTDRHVRHLIDDGEIVSHQFGTAIRIGRIDLCDYISRGRRSK